MNRELLEQPFPASKIKKRGGRGRTLDYVETAEVIKRLNEAFDGIWSFRIVNQERFEKEVVVTGELEAEGCVKQQFGSKEIAFKSGTTDPLSLADTYKSAASDAIKKCATLFGVALHLYGDQVAPNGQSATNGAQSPPPATRVQSTDEKAVWAIAKKLGLDKSTVCTFNRIDCDDGGKWKTAITPEGWKRTRGKFKTLEEDVNWMCRNGLGITPKIEFAEVVALVHAQLSWKELDALVAEAKSTGELDTLAQMLEEYRNPAETEDLPF